MKIVAAAEMREIDRVTSERFGVSSISLMENAGTAVAEFVAQHYPQTASIGIICGKGNNGGDGLVAARKLMELGRKVRVLLLANPEELRGDAAAMFAQLPGKPVIATSGEQLATDSAKQVFQSDVILDAILGTGFKPPVTGLYADAITAINQSHAKVVAVDIPSGTDADLQQAPAGLFARADAVVTFTAPRPAHVLGSLTEGPTSIIPIASPDAAIVSQLGLNLITPRDFAAVLDPRRAESNKGSYGHVLVMGGARGKYGAPAMAAIAALRSGAGLATIATATSILPTVAGFHPEVMTEPLEETSQGTISTRCFDSGSLEAALTGKTVLAIGPGISRQGETASLVRRLLAEISISTVLDADGLNAFEGRSQEIRGQERTLVLTPHPGEMARLLGCSIPEVQAHRIEVAKKFAREHEVILVLKGHRTLVARPDGEIWINTTGNAGMATGGTGDILTGIIAGLIAQNQKQPFEAVIAGVYLHGLAGDVASERMGQRSLIATDLVAGLPEAFLRAGRSVVEPSVDIHS
jgi:NAD(P)H-hydrate epimerase